MHLPKRVTIELTNRCNRNCEGCPRHKMNYPQGDINENLFTEIITQLPNTTTMVPFYRGESTLHRQFSSFLTQLHRFRDVQFATNGDYLTPQNKQAILQNVTFLSLSLHSFLMPHETRWLSFLYDCLGAGVDTQVSIVDTEVDETHRGRFITEWKQHVNRVRIYETHSQDGFGSMNCQHPISACSKPFEDMVVYWDGKVGLCNHDWNNQTYLGDLNVQSVEEVWRGLPYEVTRSQQRLGMRGLIPSCRNCSFESNKIYGEVK